MIITFIATNRNPDRFRSDPSFVYRCENPGLALADRGHDVRFVHLRDFDLKCMPGAVLFHRPRATLRLWYWLGKLRRLGIPAVADVDDLIFDEHFVDSSPGVRTGQVSRRLTRRYFRAHRRALAWFDGILVSTAPLATHIQRLFPDKAVAVMPNCVHRDWRRAPDRPRPSEEKRVTYFPGTRSHNRDFSEIEAPLGRFLEAHPEVRLAITGPLEFRLRARPGQILHDARVPYTEYRSRVRGGWVNLAPLEPTPFNECKSALKILEAGYWNIPTLCSPNADNRRFIGAGALIAETPEAWVQHLEQLLDDARYRKTTDGLRERILTRADIDAQASHFLDFLGWLARAS